MGVSVYDESGQKFAVNSFFDHTTINQPIVTERREKHSFWFGDAELVQLAFSGIYIVYGDMLMREKKTLHFDMAHHQQLVEMHFSLSGSAMMYNQLSGQRYSFKGNETNMHYTPAFSGLGDFTATNATVSSKCILTPDFSLSWQKTAARCSCSLPIRSWQATRAK